MPIQSNKLTGKHEDRNYGIDLLRLVAMFMIVILHVLGQGGVLNNVSEGGVEL